MPRQQNPSSSVNPLTALSFYWALKVFYRKHWGHLHERGAYAPLMESSEHLGNKLEKLWQEELNRGKHKHSLLRVLVKAFGCKIIMMGIVVFFVEVLRLSQPLLLGQVILYFSTGGTEKTIRAAFIYAVFLALNTGLIILIEHPQYMYIAHMGMRINVALDSLIYRKVLKLNISSLDENSSGFMLDLMCADAAKLDAALKLLHFLWIGPIETIVVSYFIWVEVREAALFGITSFLLTIPLQGVLGEITATFHKRSCLNSDERVSLMSEIINGIQVIKMFTWETMFKKQAEAAYSKEIKELRRVNYLKGIMLSFVHFITRISVFSTFVSHVLLLDTEITAKKVFVIASLFELLRTSMTILFPNAIFRTREAFIALKRIKKLLELDEAPKKIYRHENRADEEFDDDINSIKEDHNDESNNIIISIQNVSSKWFKTQKEDTIKDVTVEVQQGMLVAVVGVVGSGKTSLLLTILGELHVTKGTIALKGRISYASQNPWLFTGTIKANILFDQAYDEKRYNEVIHICALRHDLQELPYLDETEIIGGGITLSGGQRARINLARAIYRDADIYLLDSPLAELDSHVSTRLFNDCITGYLKNKTVIFVTHDIKFFGQTDKIIIMDNGCIAGQGTLADLQSGKHLKLYENLEKMTGLEKFPSKIFKQHMSLRSTKTQEFRIEKDIIYTPDELTFRSIIVNVFTDYFRAGGSYFFVTTVLLLCIISQVMGTGSDFWIAHWTNINEKKWKLDHNVTGIVENDVAILSTRTCIIVYACLMVATVVFTLIRTFAFYTLCMKAAMKLHNTLVNNIIHTTMEFFYKNPTGKILAVFTNDVRIIQEVLPPLLLSCIQMILMGVSVMVVIAYVNYKLLFPTFVLLLLGFFLRKLYINTARNLKKLQVMTFHSLTQFVAATVQGLTTIRACDAQKECRKVYQHYQDLYASTLYLHTAMNEAFAFYLDSMCLTFSIVVIFSFLLTQRRYLGGNVGLVVTQSVIFTSILQWGVMKLTELENELLSVETISQFINAKREHPFKSRRGKKPPYTWPSAGRIEFKKVNIRYEQMGPLKLKHLNFVIRPAEKVGIVGRTGCGKSTLIRSLFRLHVMEGKILIDKKDITDIGLHDLRKKISIIPQEPVLFSDTVRRNLDPYSEYPDSALWDALEEVEMKETIRDLQFGLYLRVYQGGVNFSVGQRQLLCLARALLWKNKILVMDEATSSIDPKVEQLIMQKLHKKFANCTVLTIAHRLSSVINSDRILVLVDGTVAEFDHPYKLLNKTDGAFFRLAQESGEDMMRFLFWKAKRNYREMMANKKAIQTTTHKRVRK